MLVHLSQLVFRAVQQAVRFAALEVRWIFSIADGRLQTPLSRTNWTASAAETGKAGDFGESRSKRGSKASSGQEFKLTMRRIDGAGGQICGGRPLHGEKAAREPRRRHPGTAVCCGELRSTLRRRPSSSTYIPLRAVHPVVLVEIIASLFLLITVCSPDRSKHVRETDCGFCWPGRHGLRHGCQPSQARLQGQGF